VIVALSLVGLLGGCASGGDTRTEVAGSGGSDGADIPDAVPRVEPLSRSGNPASYKVRGKRYFTKTTSTGHVERGLASWYGKQFHGRKTSSGERYDMYAMTAAHKTLPLPTYVQVTNVENGRTAVVKVNDRGPFHGPRVIDLSYSAAKKLGVVQKGTAMVEVRAIDPSRPAGDPGPFLAAKGAAKGKPSHPPALAHQASKPTPVPVPGPAVVTSTPAEAGAEAAKGRALDAALAAVEATPLEGPAEPSVKPAAAGTEKEPGPVVAASGGLYLQVGAFGDPSNAERLRQRLVANLSEQVRVQRSATGEPALFKVRIGPLGSEGEARTVSAKLVTLGVDQPRRVWN
jgi:rare lipoprotein A